MYYGKINPCDTANGPGCRVSLFVSGCRNHCPGCFQPETWAFDYGQPFTPETEEEIIRLLGRSWVSGLSVLGGDPMEPENQERLLRLLKRVKYEYPKKDVWIYTGYKFGKVCRSRLLQYTDILVDGPFVEALKNPGLQFRGSSNQRVIRVKESLVSGEVVIRPDDPRGMPGYHADKYKEVK